MHSFLLSILNFHFDTFFFKSSLELTFFDLKVILKSVAHLATFSQFSSPTYLERFWTSQIYLPGCSFTLHHLHFSYSSQSHIIFSSHPFPRMQDLQINRILSQYTLLKYSNSFPLIILSFFAGGGGEHGWDRFLGRLEVWSAFFYYFVASQFTSLYLLSPKKVWVELAIQEKVTKFN